MISSRDAVIILLSKGFITLTITRWLYAGDVFFISLATYWAPNYYYLVVNLCLSLGKYLFQLVIFTTKIVLMLFKKKCFQI